MQSIQNTDFVLKIKNSVKTLWKNDWTDKKGTLQLELELENESSNS